MKKEIEVTKKPSLSSIESMYHMIILKNPKVLNNYKEASELINKEFGTSVDQYDLERALDVDIQTSEEDLRLMYINVE